MKEYSFEQIDNQKIDDLFEIIPEIRAIYITYSNDLIIFDELDKQVKRIYKKNLKPEKELKQKKWEAKQNFLKSRKQIFELTEKWNSEMISLSEKYNYISLHDFYGFIRNTWEKRPSKKLNFKVSLIAKTIKISLLFQINIGYDKVQFTNLYPKKWLETNGQEMFEESEKNLPTNNFEKYKR